jgi:tetraacyldisaccharide 4'-kinase
LLCRLLAAHGQKPGVLSRGYGAKLGTSNDEALVLGDLLRDVPHVQDPDRVRGAAELARRGVSVVVMDDGFSHLRLQRDIDVLLFDATQPFGYEALLPRGLLREPLKAARRAHLAIITRCDAVSEQALVSVESRLAELGFSGPRLLHARHQPCDLLALGGEPPPSDAPAALLGASVAALSGIGNPSAFRATLQSLGANVVAECPLPDHFAYPDSWLADEWPAFAAKAAAAGARAVVTTHKDAVKLAGRIDAAPLPLWQLRIEMKLSEGEAALWKQIEYALAARGKTS